jgi:NACHT domain
MSKTWTTFEERVRELASFIWERECSPIHIGGVNIDAAITVGNDIRVFIEITERNDLAKVREDVGKLRTAKAALLAETGEFARCYCIVNGSVTPAMVEAGKPHKISVVSIKKFGKQFFDFETYRVARESAAFGSAVNPLTGIKDDSDYIPVKYVVQNNSNELSTDDIADLLENGERIILLGEYGSGKSRCFQELFKRMAARVSDNHHYPIAIDLREGWGLKRGQELIRRHFSDLGADALQSAAIRALNKGCLTLLLDGFDELGSQAWSNDNDKLRVIRAKSLEGVRDLISRTRSGVIISGREHYFNNNEEMLSALGLNQDHTTIIRCKVEFSEKETQEFFERIKSEVVVPSWLPRRPLICQTIANLSGDELDEMFGLGDNEIEFWNHFLKVLCLRDARIHASFDAQTIETVLMHLARTTRVRPANVGPITLGDVQIAFEAVVGQTPVEEAAVMLQRLPALGRVGSESNDRQFIDVYILDGLRARDAANSIRLDESTLRQLTTTPFRNPLDDLGQRLLAASVGEKIEEYRQMAARCLANGNKVLGCDIAASLLRADLDTLDFKRMYIDDGHFLRLDMSNTLPSNLIINSTVIGELVLPSSPPPGTTITNCLATRVFGVAAASGLPAWIKNLTADLFDSVESVSRIRKIGLDPRHEILVTVVRKTFFQKGSGRKEVALLRGLKKVAAPAVSDRIVNLLLREQILERFKGDEGWVYSPNREFAGRMKRMLYELKASQDPIWIAVSTI